MKKFIILLLAAAIFTQQIFCKTKKNIEQNSIENEDELINPKTGFPEIKDKPFVVFNEGLSFSMINRLEKQENRSNFIWEDYLIGGFFSIMTQNMKPVESLIRVQAFYPFYHTFDGMQQFPKQTILYAFDLFAGPIFQTDMWKYVNLNFAAGLHYMYQLSDEYHLNYLGGAALLGVELPLSKRWSILMNGTFTLDYPNLGTNKLIQPYDLAWQYQFEVGVRYSKKKQNQYHYINVKQKKNEKRFGDMGDRPRM